MSQTIHDQRQAAAGTNGRKRAVLYLRVSTPSQVTTDYNPEGISIPAQREKAEAKAADLRADIVREFIEPGKTATAIDKRPVFQEMLAWVKAEKDVDYIVVYHFSRIFRNSIDAAITKSDLAKVGTRVISTVLHLNESPESNLIETIMHAVDQYQSEASGADIRYKMGQKAKNGGTITLAKLGYRNVGEQYDGHEVRTVAVDPERGPLITRLFELFASGQYSGPEVHDQITAAGLRTRGNKRYPSGQPISMSQLYTVLADRYYLGFIEYDGIEYPGRHQPLTTPEVFDRVQRVLSLRGGNGSRQRKYEHYLKGGLLWCAACGHRYVIARGKGNGGQYFYFFCRGRQQKLCEQPYLRVEDIERKVEAHYATVRLDDAFQTSLRRQFDELLKDELGSLSAVKKRLRAQLDRLEGQEDRYLDLIGDPDWPQAKLKQKLATIRREREQLETQLAGAGSKLDTGRRFFELALDLMRDPQAAYRTAGPALRHAMNKVIFGKLYVGADGVAAHTLAPGFQELMQLREDGPAYGRSSVPRGLPPVYEQAWNESSPVLTDGAAAWSLGDQLPTGVATDHGWNKTDLVGVTGFEPAASSSRIMARKLTDLREYKTCRSAASIAIRW